MKITFKKMTLTSIAALITLVLLFMGRTQYIKYRISKQVLNHMSTLYPDDTFHIEEVEIERTTPLDWVQNWFSNNFKFHSDNWSPRHVPLWSETYRIEVESDLLQHFFVVTKKEDKWENKYEKFRNEQITGWIYKKLQDLLPEELPVPYIHIERNSPLLTAPTTEHAGGKDLQSRMVHENDIQIWFITDKHESAYELIQMYEKTLWELIETLYEEWRLTGSYDWKLVCKKEFFNDYYIQDDLLSPSHDEENFKENSWDSSRLVDWFYRAPNEIKDKLEAGEALNEEDINTLYFRLHPFYYRLKALKKHIIYSGSIICEIDGSIKQTKGKKNWCADPYSFYPQQLQNIVRQIFGKNAYGSFINTEPETNLKICVYVFDQPTLSERKTRQFVSKLTTQTIWEGTVDVFYMRESQFFENSRLIRSLYSRQLTPEEKESIKPLGFNHWLGENHTDFYIFSIQKRISSGETQEHREEFYKKMILHTEVEKFDDEVEEEAKSIYVHYRSTITKNPELQIISQNIFE